MEQVPRTPAERLADTAFSAIGWLVTAAVLLAIAFTYVSPAIGALQETAAGWRLPIIDDLAAVGEAVETIEQRRLEVDLLLEEIGDF
ncbi:hypothetical protein [Pseudactinotalea sp. Z1748]|uniref:hypothetical protein n=1 Tax=Pseudactinotalea sp. Z1748 TaxID=3413027 RepID=UPI003C7EC647